MSIFKSNTVRFYSIGIIVGMTCGIGFALTSDLLPTSTAMALLTKVLFCMIVLGLSCGIIGCGLGLYIDYRLIKVEGQRKAQAQADNTAETDQFWQIVNNID